MHIFTWHGCFHVKRTVNAHTRCTVNNLSFGQIVRTGLRNDGALARVQRFQPMQDIIYQYCQSFLLLNTTIPAKSGQTSEQQPQNNQVVICMLIRS